MHCRSLPLFYIKAFKRPAALILAALFLAGVQANARIGENLTARTSVHAQTQPAGEYLLPSLESSPQSLGPVQGLLPAAVSLSALLTILLRVDLLTSAVISTDQQAIPSPRGPPAV